jgi:TPR repeat protein
MHDDHGKGVPKNYAEAVKWYRLGADQGDARCQWLLGGMYNAGKGVPQSYATAVKWYRLAAAQGYPNGQWVLGTMFEHGWGVPQSYVLAHMWYNLAAAAAHDHAPDYRDRIASKMTSSQIAEAQRLAAEWKPK